ncbi:MAG: maleylpyruvate isomerase family mycothiol-dependent enzyme [Acidimicrobiales bacterium]
MPPFPPRYDGPPILSIEGAPNDQLVPLVRQRRRMQAALQELNDEQWRSASRCAGWTVQDVAAHLVGVNTFWRASVMAGLAGAPTRLLVGFDPVATPGRMVDAMRSLDPLEVYDQLVSSNEAFLGAVDGLDDAGWCSIGESPPGHVPIRLLAQHALWDCWVHERDVMLPLGLTPVVEADEVCSALRYVAALVAVVADALGSSPAGVFGVEGGSGLSFLLEMSETIAVRNVEPPADAPCLRGNAVELLEALSLRQPLPESAPPEWRDLLGGLATAFGQDAGVT